MDLQKYTQDALRTEAGAVTEIKVNEMLLIGVIQHMMFAGQMLDQIKKHVFYKRPYNMEEMGMNLSYMVEALQTLTTLTPEEINNDESVMDINPRIFHAVVGMTTEAVELLEALRFYGEPMDLVNMAEECGDMGWYTAVLLDEAGADWDEVLHRNIAKLKARFPEKFTQEAANVRDLKTERKILEGDPPPSEST